MCDSDLEVFEKCRVICEKYKIRYRIEGYDIFIDIPSIDTITFNNVDVLYKYLMGFSDGYNYGR